MHHVTEAFLKNIHIKVLSNNYLLKHKNKTLSNRTIMKNCSPFKRTKSIIEFQPSFTSSLKVKYLQYGRKFSSFTFQTILNF